jgi:hypothetical protein
MVSGRLSRDSYAIDIKSDRGSCEGVRLLATSALSDPPVWFHGLLALRDAIVRPFGVKTSDEVRNARLDDARVDFFPVLRESENEIFLGEDDTRLDFRLSLLRRVRNGHAEVIAITVVHVHNRVGRAYIGLINPFRHQVVRRIMLRLAHRTAPNSSQARSRLSFIPRMSAAKNERHV